MSCANCVNTMYQKSSVDAYNPNQQSVAVGGLITLTNGTVTGCSMAFSEGSNQIRINRAGLYQVTFSAYGVENGTTGNVTVQMYNNGSPVAGAVSSFNSTAATDIGAISFSKLVQVAPSCGVCNNSVALTFVNTGVAADFGNVQVDVVKLA